MIGVKIQEPGHKNQEKNEIGYLGLVNHTNPLKIRIFSAIS